MIDVDKIESAAKAANRDNTTLGDIEEHWCQANPAIVLKMVSMIRERDAVLKQALEALEFGGWTPPDANHCRYVTKAIASIKEILK